MIKYLGSKRLLVPVLGRIAASLEPKTAVDLFSGTTRVAQELKRRGIHTTAVDVATYSEVLGQCYISTDGDDIDRRELDEALARLNALPGYRGYFTETFCEESRFVQPKNGVRVDAIRDAIEEEYAGTPLHPILLTSLLIATDRVDSTTGVQMAYLKQWAPRSERDLQLVAPELIPGPGRTIRGDALEVVDQLDPVDLMYLDPPYNQHRYFTNYHVWETLVRWDAPEHYGVACKRVDGRDPSLKSVFNLKREMPRAFADLVRRARAEVLLVSYNDESWITSAQMMGMLHDAGREDVQMLAFDSRRYIGAQIGIHSPAGKRVGTVSHLRNMEYVFVAGPRDRVRAAIEVGAEAATA